MSEAKSELDALFLQFGRTRSGGGYAHTMNGHGPCMMNHGFTRSKINCHYLKLAGNYLKIPFTGRLNLFKCLGIGFPNYW